MEQIVYLTDYQIKFSNTVTFPKPVWIGFGVHAAGTNFQTMQNADIVVGIFNQTGDGVRFCFNHT